MDELERWAAVQCQRGNVEACRIMDGRIARLTAEFRARPLPAAPASCQPRRPGGLREYANIGQHHIILKPLG